jgi:hypothetical protein
MEVKQREKAIHKMYVFNLHLDCIPVDSSGCAGQAGTKVVVD